MKWIRNFLKREKGESLTSEIALSEIQGWLDERASNPDFEEKAFETYSKMEALVAEFRGDIESLKAASPDEKAPPKLLNAGLAAREVMANHMEALVEKIVPPQAAEIVSVSEYHSRLVKGLGNAVTKYGRVQRYVAALFPEEARNIKSSMTMLSHALFEFGDAISQRQTELEELGSLRELASKVQAESRQIKTLKKKLEDKENALAELQAMENTTRSDLDNLASGDKGQKIRTLKEELALKDKNLIRIEAEMAELVVPLTKALTRLAKLDSSDRLELKHGSALKLLSYRPAQAMDSDIKGMLVEMREKLDLLGLKDRKRDKIIEHIDSLIEDGSLELLKVEHSELEAKIKYMERDLFDSSREMAQRRNELGEIQHRIEKMLASIDQDTLDLEAKEARSAKDIEDLKSGVEKMAGRPLEIDLWS